MLTKDRQKTSGDDLADQLLVEILCRLPTTKCAVRFKTVCKRWFNLISNRYFIHRFISQHCHLNSPGLSLGLVPLPQSQLLLIPSSDPNSETGLDEIGFLDRLLPDLLTRVKEEHAPQVRVIGVYNDLLLCFKWEEDEKCTFYICNPQTKDWIEVPYISISNNMRIQGALIYQHYYYSSNNNIDAGVDYRFRVVVFVFDVQVYRTSKYHCQGHIFSSESGEWDEIEFLSQKSFHPWLSEGDNIVHNDMVYFYDMKREGMIALDPFMTYEENANIVVDCRFVEWPKDAPFPDNFAWRWSKIGVCQGRLRLCRTTMRANSLWIWDLKDYRTSDWSLQYNIVIRDLIVPKPFIFNNLSIVALHPFCGDSVYLMFGYQIFLCELKRRRLKRIFTHHIFYDPYGDFRAFCLLPQWWPTPLMKAKK